MRRFIRRLEPHALLLIVLLGLAVRLWVWWRVPDHAPANDENEYLRVARDLVAGRGWEFYEQYRWLRAPLYPLFLAGSLWLADGDLRWAALPNIVLSTATIVLWYLLGKAVVADAARGRRAGLFAAAISAVLLPFVTFASLWMSETLWTALFVAALVTLLHWVRRPRVGVAVLAGVLLGAAALTRSASLAALPLLVIWMVAWRPRGARWRPYVVGAALVVVMTCLTIAPWTIRNYRAYGGFIPVETGLSYNMWAFNEPRETMGTIHRMLEAIPNPVERAAYANAKGTERLREDPLILARKVVPNWVYLWRVKPIQDRFLQESYYEDVPFAAFAGAILLDDGLYMLILASAALALLVMPWTRSTTLLLGWLVYVVGVTVVTHGEARYRQLLFPALIPLAASLWAVPWWNTARNARRAGAVVLAVLMLVVPLQSYPYGWAWQGVRYGALVALGDFHAWRGDDAGALARYDQAASVDRWASGAPMKMAQLYEGQGELQLAAKAYGRARDRNDSYFVATTRLGDVLRRMGDEAGARRAFEGFYADQQAITDWGWQHLRSSPAPLAVAVGDGLDIGFVGGMYAPEDEGNRRVRWTGGAGAIRLRAGTDGTLVRVHLAAPRPDNQSVSATMCAYDRCVPITVDATWRTYEMLVPPRCTAQTCDSELELRLLSPTFVPSTDPNGDTRTLGLLVDSAGAMDLAAPNERRRKTRVAMHRASLPSSSVVGYALVVDDLGHDVQRCAGIVAGAGSRIGINLKLSGTYC